MSYLLTRDPSPDFGTGLVQRIGGLGNYLLTADPSPDYGTGLVQRIHGMGCRGDGNCGCSGCGLGVFDGGFDLKTWGPVEWSIVGLGLVGVFTVFTKAQRGVSYARKSIRSRGAKTRRRRELESELRSL